MDRRAALSALGAAALAPLAARGQSPGKPHRIGIVLPFPGEAIDRKAIPVQRPLEEALAKLGWVDGRSVQLLWRAKEAIEELVRFPVDILVAFGDPEAATRATRTIPIVAYMSVTGDGVSAVSRRAVNLTGISVEAYTGLAQKRLALLKEAAGVKRVARFYLGERLRFGSADELLPEHLSAAKALGLEVFPVEVGGPDEIRAAFRDLARRESVGLMVGAVRGSLPGMEARWDALMEQVARYRIPAIYDVPLAADEGGLMGYGENVPERARRLAYFVDRILRGAKPADLPIEQPTAFELALNLKAAEAIGVKFPPSVLLQADRVIR